MNRLYTFAYYELFRNFLWSPPGQAVTCFISMKSKALPSLAGRRLAASYISYLNDQKDGFSAA